jgi:hypothetical protein
LHGGGKLGDYETVIYSSLETRDSLAIITQEATRKARLTDDFNKIYPLLRKYVSNACFETKVDIESEEMAVFLSDILNREKIAKVFAKALGDLVSVKDPVKIEGKPIKLSATKPFLWNRKHIECKKTIFNRRDC